MTQEICSSKSEGHRLIKQLGLHESTWGDFKGADKQYRDSRSTNSIHAREFPTHFCFHRDKYNPEKCLIEHLLADVLKPEAALAGGLTFAISLACSRNWKSALCWGLGVGTSVQLLSNNSEEQINGESKRGVASLI